MPVVNLSNGLRRMIVLNMHHLPIEDLQKIGLWIRDATLACPSMYHERMDVHVQVPHHAIDDHLDQIKQAGFSEVFQAIFETAVSDHDDLQLLIFQHADDAPTMPGLRLFDWHFTDGLKALHPPAKIRRGLA